MALVIALGYGHTLSYPFHYDDFSSIRDNPALDHLGDLATLWHFRPSRIIVHYTLALDRALTGASTSGMRIVNLAIHMGASLLVGWIAAVLASRLRPPTEARDELRPPRWGPSRHCSSRRIRSPPRP